MTSHLFMSICNAKVEIQSLFVPRFVENGTEDSIILDCLYTLDPNEDSNLVVKWFLNDDPEPIYQWIPELKARHASKRLQGRINMDFTVNTADPLTQYRALNILRPTIDLSGKYSCHVLSLSSQDSEEETMIVYAPPKSFDFNYTRNKDTENQLALRTRKGAHQWHYSQDGHPGHSALGSTAPDGHYGDYNQHQHQHLPQHQHSPHDRDQQDRDMPPEWQPTSATLSCQVRDVFPVPEMTIYRVSDDDSKTQVLTEIVQKIDRNANGAYNVTITSDIRDYELIETYGSHRSNYECLLLLPDGSKNNYQRKKRITYLTGVCSITGVEWKTSFLDATQDSDIILSFNS
ncbi:unnamed protein product [Oppiella nova]|uniref:Ig-like domain-containing protein n=1 Tax=Oppiella nova TaxID=334625 RepID=A0A7R9QC83_9ACAR|nr:unnamed protein product [Oppiella nova]CAG2162985.1 unnamed protein product [Oppiella nova]